MRTRRGLLLLAVALLLLAGGAAGWWWYCHRKGEATVRPTAAPVESEPDDPF
jgi:hypothetical protein